MKIIKKEDVLQATVASVMASITYVEKLTLIAIIGACNDDLDSTISAGCLADRTSLGVRSITKSIAKLKSLGLISTKGKGVQGRVLTYTVHPEAVLRIIDDKYSIYRIPKISVKRISELCGVHPYKVLCDTISMFEDLGLSESIEVVQNPILLELEKELALTLVSGYSYSAVQVVSNEFDKIP